MVILAAVLLAIAAVQGAVVFGTAYLGVRVFKVRHPAWKFLAMLLSWAVWTFVTLAGYAATGGSFSLFHGLVVVLALCATAIIGSIIYLVAWTLWPARPGRATAS